MNKQTLQDFIQKQHEDGKKVAVSFCSHVPQEILVAAGITSFRVPFIEDAADSACRILPSNVCPMVKNCCNVCEDEAMKEADLLIAETSCDGKKKLYELISNQERVYFYQVAQGSDRDYVNPLIQSESKFFVRELNRRFGIQVTKEMIRNAGAILNQERKSIQKVMELQKQVPPKTWGADIFSALEKHRLLAAPEQRTEANLAFLETQQAQESPVPKKAKRILITGCPLTGVYRKVLESVEANGGVVVCFENCETLKSAVRHFNTETEDIYAALADCYQNTACAIMAPNDLRMDLIRNLSEEYKVDGILDITLQTCHAYTVERDRMNRFCEDELAIPYMAVETDTFDSDRGQLATRISAFIEML